MNIGKELKEHNKLVEELLELGDVKYRLEQVEKYYDSDKIKKQVLFKKNKNN
jgi:hypothetical protein